MITVWVFLNEKFCRWFRWIQIDQQLPDTLPSRSQWWLIASNHQSWADIVILQIVFRKLAPPIKFFTKRELIWVPFLGFGLWLLRFPYVRRRRRDSGNFQHKQRQKTQQELARAASQFHERPIALLLFLEGTRFTPEKHVDQCPPYQYLLRPKLGGLTFTLDTLASKIDRLVNVTVSYDGKVPGFWNFLCGRCPQVVVRVETIPVTPDFIHDLKAEITKLWLEKDRLLKEWYE